MLFPNRNKPQTSVSGSNIELNSSGSCFQGKHHINLKEKVSQLNKTLYKTKVHQNKIEKLERDAIRGECAEIPEAKIAPKQKKKGDILSKILKSEHKATVNGTQILKLPKNPFGKHNSYNDEYMFKEKHFFADDSDNLNPERLKELEDITRKFRLHEKKYKATKRNRLHTAKAKLSNLSTFDVYDMGAGRLICCKDEKIIGSYNQDKEKYRNLSLNRISLTFKNIESAEVENKLLSMKTLKFKDQDKLLSRLLPNKEAKDTTLSQFFSSKYSSLFEPDEPKNRKNEYRRSSMN